MTQIFEEAVDAVKQVLTECEDGESGTCWERPPAGKGYIIWSDDRQGCQDSNILLPGFSLLHRGLLIVCYILFFIWIFFGVSIASDVFSEAIEIISSSTKKVVRKNPRTGEDEEVEEPVWNWVLANLSLMAFGTSAPEILLSVIETLVNLGRDPGKLGPSTIVGSAAYNFFVIPGVCSISLAAGEFKRLEQIWVFACTASWSLWAYLWVYLVYSVISPGVIDIWEAWVTLAFFPLLLGTAFVVDKAPYWWGRRRPNSVADVPLDDLDLEVSGENATGSLGSKQASALPTDIWAATSGADSHSQGPRQRHSILYWRMLAVRQVAGETKSPEMLALAAQAREQTNFDHDVDMVSGRFLEKTKREAAAPAGTCKLGFSSLHYSVLESDGVARVLVRRYEGDLSTSTTIRFATKDGTAVAGIDYEATEGELKFSPGESTQEILIKIIDDDMSEPDVTFYVTVSHLWGAEAFIVQDSAPVTIVDDDDGGMLMFELPTLEAGSLDGYVDLPVVRRNGADGQVTVEYATKDGTGSAALSGKHYKETRGTLSFEAKETRSTIRVPLLSAEMNNMAIFKVELMNPLGGAVLGKRHVCRVIITPGRHLAKGVEGSSRGSDDGSKGEDEDDFHLWSAWGDQFKEAILPQLEDGADFIWVEMFMHYIAITWKVICAFIPPTGWKGAYPSFAGSLIILVGIIYLAQEVAELLGCSVTLSPMMTGLALVAIGTSLPDTFASRMAAVHDETADAAIGNITGSNSFNVFLGLGIPWVIATGYYHGQGEKMEVSQGELGFTLVLFIAGFVVQMVILMYRRAQGGELGGSRKAQWWMLGSSLTIWLAFLVLSGVQDYEHFEADV